jgi:tetratricopeptide (TPR) repeat protein
MSALLFSTRRLRRVATICLLTGLLLLAAMCYCAMTSPREQMIPFFAEGIAFLMLGVGLGAGLKAMAKILETKEATGPSSIPAELNQQIAQLRNTLDEIASPNTSLPPADQTLLSRIDQALEEIREFTLMTDHERQERLQKFVDQRRRQLMREVTELIGKQDWARADHLLATLESHFPNDNAILDLRFEFTRARGEVETESVREAMRRVDGLIIMESFDAAIAVCTKLVENFPTNADARTLLQSVSRQRDLHIDSSAQKLFEEIRTEIERRNWRSALPVAQRLLNRFPQHARAMQIREQLNTIHDNAEIQERQEIEVQIEEFVRAQRFGEAISLGEDVVRRFPLSPQAQTLKNTILPRLREVLNPESQPATS